MFKHFYRQEQRKKGYNCYESVIRNKRLCLPSQVLSVRPKCDANGEHSKKILHHPDPAHVLDDDVSSEEEIELEAVDSLSSDSVSDSSEVGRCTHDYDSYFTQLAMDWERLCDAYEKKTKEKQRSEASISKSPHTNSSACFNLAVLNDSLQKPQTVSTKHYALSNYQPVCNEYILVIVSRMY